MYVSSIKMKHISKSQSPRHLLRSLPDLSGILRGSLLRRTIRHRQGCRKCAQGHGHPMWVLTVAYPGGRTRQISLHSQQVPQVRQGLKNYQKAKKILESVSELNQQGLRQQRQDARHEQDQP